MNMVEQVWALGFNTYETRRMTRDEANADPGVWIYFDYDPTEQLARAKEMTEREKYPDPERWANNGQVQVFGSGDTTNTVYGDNGQPYRFKSGDKKGQKAEIRERMERRFQQNNKAPWPVNIDVTYD